VFCQFFDRQFPDLEKFRRNTRPALRAILAAREPLPIEILQRLFKWQDEELRDFTRTLGSLFPTSTDGGAEAIKPYHKSLTDWLAQEPTAGAYFVSVKEGQRLLADFCHKDYHENPSRWLPYTLRHLVAYLIDAQDWHSVHDVLQDTGFVGAAARKDGMGGYLDSLYLSLSRYERTEKRRYVYVSSTFSDMMAERDAIYRQVFPKLRKLATGHGLQLEAIDMNRGITDQADLNQQTMDRCLAAIERCQRTSPPVTFLFLLGGRYGWCPLPSRIEARELENLLALLSDGDELQLVAQWYVRDDNAVPAEYCLRPRVGVFVDGAIWAPVEARLRSILQLAVNLTGWTANDPRRAKYEKSVVHREILAGLGPSPEGLTTEDRQHVFGFFRSITALPEDPGTVRLKQEMSEIIPENVHAYAASWTGDGPGTEHLRLLCDEVHHRLSQLIEAEPMPGVSRSPIDEQEAHDAFARESNLFFVGRETILHGITHYLVAGGGGRLLLHGPPGSGKSAVMAKASEGARINMPTAVVVRRFVGVTPASSESRSLLEGLCMEIAEGYGVEPYKGRHEYEMLMSEFIRLLSLSTSDRPLLLFIDDIDELDVAKADRLSFDLPHMLPPHARMVFSATASTPTFQTLAHAVPSENIVDLGPLTASDCEHLLVRNLEFYRRTLNPSQRSRIFEAISHSGLPFCQVLAINEACRWRSYDDVRPLPGDTPGMLALTFDRLAMEHGQALVSRALGYLAASRFGLSETELRELLSRDADVYADYQRRAHTPASVEIPQAFLLALLLSLQPYLTERRVHGVDVLSFSHKTILKRAAEVYLTTVTRPQVHRNLALYFSDSAFLHGKDSTEDLAIPSVRALMELAYQTGLIASNLD